MPPADARAATILAHLPVGLTVASVHRDGRTLIGCATAPPRCADGPAGLAMLDDLGPGTWVGWCAYELGRVTEPGPRRWRRTDGAALPDVVFARLEAEAWVDADGPVTVTGTGRSRLLLEQAVAATDGGTQQAPGVHDDAGAGLWHSSLDRAEHADAVARIHEHLLSGDCYQVNLTRRLTRAGALDPFALFHALALEHPAPYATLFGGPVGDRDVHVVSASPECFLRRDGRAVVTRPIKGTASTAAELLASDKDHAEHTMIVDLARNDLGRVCTPGSVHVPALGVDEEHPGLHHLVSTVAGQLRDGIGLADLVAATFPPASITGAPKPRVLEIIDALEPVARGVYCGALGWIDTRTDSADLAVAIRTFTIDADTTQLGVGGGIVADSTARGEWAETELKARRLLAVAARVGERHRDDARATQAAAR